MKTYSTIATLLLAVVSLVQGLRFALSWPVTIGSFAVPTWFSAVACVVIGWIAIGLWREARKS